MAVVIFSSLGGLHKVILIRSVEQTIWSYFSLLVQVNHFLLNNAQSLAFSLVSCDRKTIFVVKGFTISLSESDIFNHEGG
jgi:hypothetical protein